MATEEIIWNGEKIVTLKELLKPGLRVVFVGINPSPISVRAGHYLQGKLGQRFWDRLRQIGVLPVRSRSKEDDVAFKHGYGFADLVRRPTARAKDLSPVELRNAVPNLISRLEMVRNRPTIIFVFAICDRRLRSELEPLGYRCLRMPGPYQKKEKANTALKQLKAELLD